MDTTVILRGLYIIFHMAGLRVPAEYRIIVCTPGFFHGTKPPAINVFRKKPLPYNPVRIPCLLMPPVLLNKRTKDIRHGLIQRTRLTLIFKPCLILCNTVGQLMTYHINCYRKAIEQLPVAVAINHLLSIPECVVIILTIVDGRIKAHPPVV